MKNSTFVAEAITYLHPDKICDQISDLILDAHLKQDPYSRVAVETTGGHGSVALYGEVTSKGVVDYEAVVQKYYQTICNQNIKVFHHITQQSPDISQGVNKGGAGDQGIMVGYACNENEDYIPQETYLARKLLRGFQVDAKSQIALTDGKLTSVVLSVQGQTQKEIKQHIKKCGLDIKDKNIYANFTGEFKIGGFEADSGCTGRKIVADAYGPRVPVGGGAFSGKDPTKVDRSAAYMARFVALQLLKKYNAHDVLVKIGYAIGKAEPLVKFAIIDGKETEFDYDCRPQAIIERFDLLKPIYLDLAKNGHVGRIGQLPWEKFEE